MQIEDVQCISVSVPFEKPLLSSHGLRLGVTRTLIRITAGEFVGWGEVHGGTLTRTRLQQLAPLVIGSDPREWRKFVPVLGRYGSSSRAGYEMACMDLAGKIEKCSVAAFLGGARQHRVAVAGYMFYRKAEGMPLADREEELQESMIEECVQAVEMHGFRTLKIKGGVFRPELELRTSLRIQERLPGVKLRFDPNGGWTVETTLRHRQALERLDLEYLEDPSAGLHRLAAITKKLPMPVATDTWAVTMDQLHYALKMEAFDILMADIERWGGVDPVRGAAELCRHHEMPMSMHSWGQLGIATAAQVHLVSTTPEITYAIDAHYMHQVDDIVTKPFQYEHGEFRAPTGPGLGVDVDEAKVDKYHNLYVQRERQLHSVPGVPDLDDPCRREWRPLLSLRLM